MPRTDKTSRALSEYLLLPGYIPKNFSSEKVDLSIDITKQEKDQSSSFKLNIPILSAAMQAVTGPEMAISLARLGGLGVIYCSQTIENQAQMIRKVKKFKVGFVDPEKVSPKDSLKSVKDKMENTGYSKFPVVDSKNKLLGVITDDDFDEYLHLKNNITAKDRMIKIENLDVSYHDEVNDDVEKAYLKLVKGHQNFLPIINKRGELISMVFRKDWEARRKYPDELLDNKKRYKVGAAINTHDYKKRVPALVEAGVDILFIDSSQGFTDYQKETLEYADKNFPEIPIVGGNVVTKEGFEFLVENGADAVKVGMGSGSICITQEQIGMGRGQASAIKEIVKVRNKYYKESKIYIPIISDGGVVIAKDILIALSLGADAIMTGRYLAGCEESPPPTREIEMGIEKFGGRVQIKVKPYWGEGSSKAKAWMEKRYGQTKFEEGVEGYVPFFGSLENHLGSALDKIRDGIRKSGCKNIKEFHKKSVLQLLSSLSIREGKVHDIGDGRF